MMSSTSQFTSRGLSRRHFGLVVGGSAFLLLAGGTYGVVARSPQGTTTGVATAFGSLTVLRAGRMARLDAQGRTAFQSLAAAAVHLPDGTGPGNSALVRQVRAMEPPENAGHGHDGGTFEDPDNPEPVNLTWADVVLLEVQLHNAGEFPVLFSPGQLRLKLSSSETTITPQDSDRALGPIAPLGTEHLLISYLAPRAALDLDLELEYSDGQQDRTLSLPPLTANGVRP